MRFIRETTISTPSSIGSAPPERPEPAPRATHGTSARAQAATTCRTSSARARQHCRRRRRVVLQQAVGLVGAELVLLRVDPVVPDDPAQLGDELAQVALGRLRLRGVRGDGGAFGGCG